MENIIIIANVIFFPILILFWECSEPIIALTAGLWLSLRRVSLVFEVVPCPLGGGHWHHGPAGAIQTGLWCRTAACRMCAPLQVQPAPLPLAITKDKNTDTWAVGKPDLRAEAYLAPHLFNRTLPCNFPSIVIWERLHSLTFIMSPVASIGCLSHLLIALKLQFTWIAGGWPQKILSPLAASSLGQIAIAECPMETNRALNNTVPLSVHRQDVQGLAP